MGKYILAAVLALLPLTSHGKLLQEGDYILLQTSLWSMHFRPKDDHNNNQRLVDAEYNMASGWLFGLAFFDNSFGQPSQYLYGGYNWTIPKTRELAYFKLTGGLLHGYKGEHQDAIPFNNAGIAPAILPSFGVKYKRFVSELMIFGTAGMMISVGFTIPLGDKD